MTQAAAGKIPVFVCDTQPIAAEGLKALLADSLQLEFRGSANSLETALEFARAGCRGMILLDRTLGQHALLNYLGVLQALQSRVVPIVWGISVTDAEALRFLQAGVRGIWRKTGELTTLLTCLRAVASGQSWVADCGFREAAPASANGFPRLELTPRERQVMELVEQGFKNREIAGELGISPGTVKIHLKHIFEKTGVRGRYGLALNGLKEKSLVSAAG